MLTIGSLFSGIGGLELGLEWAGLGPVLFQVEKEPFCREVLARHWPTVARFDDVCTVGAHNLPAVDLLCGGFPCPDISLAGEGAGLDGERSGLWFEFARIIGELRPRFVVVENVSALLGRGLDRVLGSLAARGYDAWWDCLPACAVGAPHRRDRIFIVAWRVANAEPERRDPRSCGPERGDMAAAGRRLRGEGGQQAAATDDRGEDVGHASGPGLAQRQVERGDQAAERTAPQRAGRADGDPQPGLGGVPDGVPAWLDQPWPAGRGEDQHPWEPPRTASGPPQNDRIKALGNAVVPDVGYAVGLIVRELEEAP